MTEYSTNIFTDSVPLSPQEIRSAALHAASQVLPAYYPGPDLLAEADACGDAALHLAVRFEDYISTGRTIPWPPALDPRAAQAPTLDVAPFADELDRVGSVLRATAEILREPDLEEGKGPVDRTGLCDHCDKPQTGGAAGGGLSPEHWCDDHRPEDWAPDYADQDPDGPSPHDDTPIPDPTTAYPSLLADLAERLALANQETVESNYRLWNPDAKAAIDVFRERLDTLTPVLRPAPDNRRVVCAMYTRQDILDMLGGTA